MKLFSLKDVLVGFNQPFMAASQAVAVRNLRNMVNSSSKNTIQEVVSDIELWQLGEFDQDTGELKASLEFVCRAVDCLGGSQDGSSKSEG